MDYKVAELLGLTINADQEAYEFLELNASKETGHYEADLTDSELIQLQERVTELSSEIKERKDEIKQQVRDAKTGIKPLESEMNALLVIHKAGKKVEAGTVYILKDFNQGVVYYISPKLTLISQRPMNLNDRQTTIDYGKEEQE